MNRIVLIFYLILGLTTGASRAQEQLSATGKLYGYVYNASKKTKQGDKSGLSGQEVVLYKYIDGKTDEGARLHRETDSEGRFEYSQLDTGKRFSYYPAAVVNGVEYYGGIVNLSPDTLEKRSDIEVFETTQSDSNIVITMQHIIATPGAGVLQVKEVTIFRNRSKYSYIGNAPTGNPGQNIVLRMNVPDNIMDLQFGGDLMSCCAVVAENHIFDTMAFKPGVRQETVSYVLPYDGNKVSLVKSIIYPSASIDVFLPENSGKLNAANFASQGLFPIRGGNYQRYSASNLARGDLLTLTFTELPVAPRDWRWVPPLVILGFVLIGVFLFKRSKKNILSKEETEEQILEEPVNTERQRLLEFILQLDEEYDKGRINKNVYMSARETFTNKILALDGEAKSQPVEGVESDSEGISNENG